MPKFDEKKFEEFLKNDKPIYNPKDSLGNPDTQKPENLPGDLTKPDNRKPENLPLDLTKPNTGRLQLLKKGGKIDLKDCKINTAESKNSKLKNCW